MMVVGRSVERRGNIEIQGTKESQEDGRRRNIAEKNYVYYEEGKP